MDRAVSGPICDEKEFSLKHVANGIAEAVKECGIHLGPPILGL